HIFGSSCGGQGRSPPDGPSAHVERRASPAADEGLSVDRCAGHAARGPRGPTATRDGTIPGDDGVVGPVLKHTRHNLIGLVWLIALGLILALFSPPDAPDFNSGEPAHAATEGVDLAPSGLLSVALPASGPAPLLKQPRAFPPGVPQMPTTPG